MLTTRYEKDNFGQALSETNGKKIFSEKGTFEVSGADPGFGQGGGPSF